MSKTLQPIKERYEKEAIPALCDALGINNVLALPRITKVVVNMGIGRILKDEDTVSDAEDAISRITGQKPVRTIARKAIAGFKIRKGLPVGLVVTLRGPRMWEFLDRLVHIALPRVRDFRGLKPSAVDGFGNLHIGLRDHTIFPEIIAEKAKTLFGFQISVVTTAGNKKNGNTLFETLKFPIAKDNSEVNKKEQKRKK